MLHFCFIYYPSKTAPPATLGRFHTRGTPPPTIDFFRRLQAMAAKVICRQIEAIVVLSADFFCKLFNGNDRLREKGIVKIKLEKIS